MFSAKIHGIYGFFKKLIIGDADGETAVPEPEVVEADVVKTAVPEAEVEETPALRSRRRLAEEWLLASGRWRDDLTDEQAQQLLDWGRAYVNEIVTGTAPLADDEAEEEIDRGVTAVLRVMQAINDQTARTGRWDEEAAQAQFNALSGTLNQGEEE